MVLKIYVTLLSQPSRAVLIFARANVIDHEAKTVDLRNLEHKKPGYLAINPMGLVPAINDDGFLLSESHAILKYLAATRSVPDHWYPEDAKKRATLDGILDWHHLNLREGAKKFVFEKVFTKSLGRPVDETVVKESEKVLTTSLKFIEENWLTRQGSFLDGARQPSIADLALLCEVKQLELLDRLDREAILGPREKIRNWVQATEEILAPHFADVHSLLKMISEKGQAKRDAKKRQSAL